MLIYQLGPFINIINTFGLYVLNIIININNYKNVLTFYNKYEKLVY